MRRIKQKNRWAYLLLFLGTGAVYLSCVDHWKVYEEPLRQVRDWCEAFGPGGILAAVGGGVQGPGWLDGVQGIGGAPAAAGVSGGSAGSFGADGVSGGNAGSFGADGVSGGNAGNFGADGVSGGAPEGFGADGAPGDASGDFGMDGVSGGGPGVPGAGEPGNYGGTGTDVTGSGNSAGGAVPDGGETGGFPGGGAENLPEHAEPPYMAVEDDYFSDAVFIGDSRTVGMFEYGGLEEISTFYASKGLTVYKMFDAEIVTVPGQKKKITVEEALQQNTFAKIYLMIGINEMGTGTVETFMEKYQEAVAHLQELQPGAIIYLQGIIKVTAERSAQGDYINNEGIVARNDAIAQLADNEKIFYLDVNPLICDETEGMNASYTFDGVHLKAQYIEIWKDYLKTHAISS